MSGRVGQMPWAWRADPALSLARGRVPQLGGSPKYVPSSFVLAPTSRSASLWKKRL